MVASGVLTTQSQYRLIVPHSGARLALLATRIETFLVRERQSGTAQAARAIAGDGVVSRTLDDVFRRSAARLFNVDGAGPV